MTEKPGTDASLLEAGHGEGSTREPREEAQNPAPDQPLSAAPEPPPVQRGESRPVDPGSAEEVLTETLLPPEDAAVLAESRRRTRRSFLVAGAAVAAGWGFSAALDRERKAEMQPALLREAFELNAALSRALDRDAVLAPTYPLSRAETLRVNGMYGLSKALAPASWRLQLVGVAGARSRTGFVDDVTAWEYRSLADPGRDQEVNPKTSSAAKMAPQGALGEAEQDEKHTGRKPRGKGEAGESNSTLLPGTPGLLLTLEDVLRFPRHELVTEFKCIEGWSQVVHWAGIRLRDFLDAYPPAPVKGREPKYVYMETPDGDYYTGYDLDACRHPQTLLVTEMMGAPLTEDHGAPLRLHMPIKYGYKQIKRIGLISYTRDKPDDYWTRLGYDWYAGL